MEFIYDDINENNKHDNCFLLTNGLGGYSSLTVSGGCARGDHALMMAALKAPNVRYNLLANVLERLVVDGKEYFLTSQQMRDGNDYNGYRYLKSFVYDDLCEEGRVAPATWYYDIDGVKLTKSLVMVQGENTVAVQYEIKDDLNREICIEVSPLFRCCSKKESFNENQDLSEYKVVPRECGGCCDINIGDESLICETTNGNIIATEAELFGKMYYYQDERDGREENGNAFINHFIRHTDLGYNILTIIFSTKPYVYHSKIFTQICNDEKKRKLALIKKAGLQTEIGKQLVISADAYIVDRDSTKGKSIIAGYPFFEDWGRDTMISLAGATIVTGRFEECKSILRTFARYVKNGLLPNLFPEGNEDPMYNSADAPLLFVNAVFEYMNYSGDNGFKEEILPVLENIVGSYINGTDYHIKMDNDGLIMAGEGLEQLTWMDVRVGDYLPTPRHGKPVEINAYWYSALRVMEQLTGDIKYGELADSVKKAFNDKFWNEKDNCLKDVISGGDDENQIRCNQIWALTMPFTMLSPDREKKVLYKIREELYTTVGLRTLSMGDKDFHPIYIGKMEERDRAYHQGTVWTFPLGAYYRACISKGRIDEVKKGIEALCYWLKEGCASQMAEIYDGQVPSVSRGCYAQAWSVCELLRAVYDYEKFIA